MEQKTYTAQDASAYENSMRTALVFTAGISTGLVLGIGLVAVVVSAYITQY